MHALSVTHLDLLKITGTLACESYSGSMSESESFFCRSISKCGDTVETEILNILPVKGEEESTARTAALWRCRPCRFVDAVDGLFQDTDETTATCASDARVSCFVKLLEKATGVPAYIVSLGARFEDKFRVAGRAPWRLESCSELPLRAARWVAPRTPPVFVLVAGEPGSGRSYAAGVMTRMFNGVRGCRKHGRAVHLRIPTSHPLDRAGSGGDKSAAMAAVADCAWEEGVAVAFVSGDADDLSWLALNEPNLCCVAVNIDAQEDVRVRRKDVIAKSQGMSWSMCHNPSSVENSDEGEGAVRRFAAEILLPQLFYHFLGL